MTIGHENVRAAIYGGAFFRHEKRADIISDTNDIDENVREKSNGL